MRSSLYDQFPQFFGFLDEGKVAIDYDPEYRHFSIHLKEMHATQQIFVCPFSGRPFPSSLREEFMNRIEALGLEPFERDTHPEAMHSEEWWIAEGL